mmetsp:Transcript_15212/g.28441  ORF Transcript_15212/g.28441 Transcript_15212/m.28441 type:complete len:83 (-) Transcript_15212:640-888(-)
MVPHRADELYKAGSSTGLTRLKKLLVLAEASLAYWTSGWRIYHTAAGPIQSDLGTKLTLGTFQDTYLLGMELLQTSGTNHHP